MQRLEISQELLQQILRPIIGDMSIVKIDDCSLLERKVTIWLNEDSVELTRKFEARGW